MARYRAAVSSQAPLQIQLTTASTQPAVITEFYVFGENASGSASFPTLSRPSTPGTGTGSYTAINPASPAGTSTIITSFSGAPSLPTVTSGSFNLPYLRQWQAPPRQGFIVPISSSALLYAAASAGHTLTGSLLFIENEFGS